jgi:hypothetical protein
LIGIGQAFQLLSSLTVPAGKLARLRLESLIYEGGFNQGNRI